LPVGIQALKLLDNASPTGRTSPRAAVLRGTTFFAGSDSTLLYTGSFENILGGLLNLAARDLLAPGLISRAGDP
jgi:hypothetical protein